MAHLDSLPREDLPQSEALFERYPSPLFSDGERAALDLAFFHAVQVPNLATEAHFDGVKQHVNDAEIVETVAAISLFGYPNRWKDTMATDLDAPPAKVAERAIGLVGWDAGKHAG